MKLTFQVPDELSSQYEHLIAFQGLPLDGSILSNGSYEVIINNSPVAVPQGFVDWTDEEIPAVADLSPNTYKANPIPDLSGRLHTIEPETIVEKMQKKHKAMHGKFTDNEAYWVRHRDQLEMLLQLHGIK